MQNTKDFSLARISGFGVELRFVTDADLPLLCHWRNTPDIRLFMEDQRMVTPKIMQVWLSRVDGGATAYAYVSYFKGKPVGFLEVKRIDHTSHSCEGGMFLFSKQYIGSGLGFYLALCREILLIKLHLSTLISRVHYLNKRSIEFCKGFGAEFSHQDGHFYVYVSERNNRHEKMQKVAQRLKFEKEWESLISEALK